MTVAKETPSLSYCHLPSFNLNRRCWTGMVIHQIDGLLFLTNMVILNNDDRHHHTPFWSLYHIVSYHFQVPKLQQVILQETIGGFPEIGFGCWRLKNQSGKEMVTQSNDNLSFLVPLSPRRCGAVPNYSPLDESWCSLLGAFRHQPKTVVIYSQKKIVWIAKLPKNEVLKGMLHQKSFLKLVL